MKGTDRARKLTETGSLVLAGAAVLFLMGGLFALSSSHLNAFIAVLTLAIVTAGVALTL